MKTIYLLIALTLSMSSQAQIEKVSLQASGLTCSMCSNAINKALKKLDFVDRVEADVKNYTFEIYFKANAVVEFGKIKDKVEGAGFSVADFKVAVRFNNVTLQNKDQMAIGNNVLVLINNRETSLNGLRTIRLVDKGFVLPKESKKNQLPPLNEGTYHATI